MAELDKKTVDSPQIKLTFSAIDQYVESNIVSNKETIITGRPFVIWGDYNMYPSYLYELYNNVATLHSVIEGTTDFICGNKVLTDSVQFSEKVNSSGQTIDDLFRLIANDIMIYNGFALNVVRNSFGNVTGIWHIPLCNIRTDKDKSIFYYSEDWTKSYGRVKTISKPKFSEFSKDESSIYYWCTNTLGVYPIPLWTAAVKACEIEKCINDYHLNAIQNGFSSSYMINFNNGIPDDNQKAEIERYVNEKLAGSQNAGRIILSFADGKEKSAELMKLDTEDYGEKYKTLAERTKQEIFTAFRAIPNLFGMPTATGFSTEEYQEAFKLYNRTMVKSRQNIICNALSKIIGAEVKVEPFTLD